MWMENSFESTAAVPVYVKFSYFFLSVTQNAFSF